MRKLLRQNLHMIKYAFLGVSVQCFFVGVSWASETTFQPKDIDKVNLLTEKSIDWGDAQGAVQQSIKITGRVILSGDKQGAPGVSVYVKGTSTGTVTDLSGDYTITVPSSESVLVFGFIGYVTQEVPVGNRKQINITLTSDTKVLDEVVVVGFGEQKKESVVGAISQTTGAILERTGGVTSLGAALTGNVPGLSTIASTGMPGEEDPRLLIRAQTSWNNSAPLVLVDNIERPLNDVDINSVETISVLKDASATAVFGVRGANGVILITTKRGKEGRANVNISMNTALKSVSKLPAKYDAYDALRIKNQIVEYELGTKPDVWAFITPQDIINNYRNQTNQEQREQYPNIDWVNYLFKDYATSYNPNVTISGGTKSVKYFGSLDYVHEGDLFKTFDSGRGYKPNFAYDRINSRTNLDFQLTKTTNLKTNLFGSYGVRTAPGGIGTASGFPLTTLMSGAYYMAGDVFYPQYADGAWGYFPQAEVETPNPALQLATAGVRSSTSTRFSTDFVLAQDLGFLLKGLRAQASVSWDNQFQENNRGITDDRDMRRKYINPATGEVVYKYLFDENTNFDWKPSIAWTSSAGSTNNDATIRTLNYQGQLFYGTQFLEKNNISLMGNALRQVRGGGSSIPSYREDWIFRTTYNYDNRYFIEYNGAYNGSEKFAPEYRFGFFSSGAAGWMLSEEKFMKPLKFIDMLKLRASYGKIGDDNVGQRFLYLEQWANNSNARMGIVPGAGEMSPYTWYRLNALANPHAQWETVTKKNFGVDFSFFNQLLSGSVDFFHDDRTNILINGTDRAVPTYFGMKPVVANLGRVQGKGYEIELRFKKALNKDMQLWVNTAMTHAVDRIIDRDDPALREAFLNNAGYANGQARSFISHGYYNTWDEMYGSTPFGVNDNKIPGSYYIVDFDADGVIDIQRDRAPYGFSGNPQNLYNATVGFDWKGFSTFVQFYGVTNVTRGVDQMGFTRTYRNTAFDVGTFWSKDNVDADAPLPRLISYPFNDYMGSQFMYDGSFVRLKNAEIAYTFDSSFNKRLGVKSMRIFLNGNNLWFWSRMPDDRESNVAGGTWSSTAYPTVKRHNIGIRLTF